MKFETGVWKFYNELLMKNNFTKSQSFILPEVKSTCGLEKSTKELSLSCPETKATTQAIKYEWKKVFSHLYQLPIFRFSYEIYSAYFS